MSDTIPAEARRRMTGVGDCICNNTYIDADDIVRTVYACSKGEFQTVRGTWTHKPYLKKQEYWSSIPDDWVLQP